MEARAINATFLYVCYCISKKLFIFASDYMFIHISILFEDNMRGS